MTVSELERRDRRISELEAKGRARTQAEQDELGRLYDRRDQHWKRLPKMIARARRKAESLEGYARQIGFLFKEEVA